MKFSSIKFTAGALALAILLTACGGGGGSGGSGALATGPEINAAPVTSPTNTALVTSVPAAAYQAASEELTAFNLLNAERGRCGFGLLAQSTQLDAAARGQNDYQILNNTASHFQNQQQFPAGFTGATAADRAAAAGYMNAGEVADEFTFASGTTDKTGLGERGMRGLLSAPYHLAGLMGGYRDFGVSARSSTDTTPAGASARVILHVNAAYKMAAGPQLIAAGAVATYPCAGSTGVNRQLKNETPNPVPGRDLSLNPIGTPIYISTRSGAVLTIATAGMRETLTNTSVVLRIPVTSASDLAGIYKSHQAYVAPDAPLKPLVEYTVTVTGTAGGVAFTTTFPYTTGN